MLSGQGGAQRPLLVRLVWGSSGTSAFITRREGEPSCIALPKAGGQQLPPVHSWGVAEEPEHGTGPGGIRDT